ncbi:hypothetical protein [Candidatus Jidaibacter acanthamoebae]|nr:hypothetical protein [Candidatus Jidaibacter acanthamoeba]
MIKKGEYIMFGALKSLIVTMALLAAIAYGAIMKLDQNAILAQINALVANLQGNFKDINLDELIRKFKQSTPK